MATKYLKGYDASELGRMMAEKAFEHLVNPLESKQNDIAGEVYTAFLGRVGVSNEQAIALCGADNNANLMLTDGHGNEVHVQYVVEGDTITLQRAR